jgi:hypothetical protein
VVKLLEGMDGGKGTYQVLHVDAFGPAAHTDLAPLRQALHLATLQEEERIDGTAKKLADIFDKCLRNLQVILTDWCLYAKVPRQGNTLQTSRMIVPEGAKGAVVLDATASTNLAYKLFSHARIINVGNDVRNYQNVTLHVRRGKTGKIDARNSAAERMPILFDDLNERLAGSNALFVCHKDTEAKALANETTFDIHVAHWGELDGANKWRDCDSAIFYDLHRRPQSWAINTFFAYQGVQSSDWVQYRSRPFGDHKDIVADILTYQTSTDLIQAINRIRCRLVVDAEGNCPKTDIYLTLPEKANGDMILDSVRRSMPSLQVRPWDLSTTTTKRKTRSDAGKNKTMVYSYLRNAPSGRYLISHLKDDLGIKPSTMKKIIKDSKEDTDSVLEAMGVSYILDGFGRGSKAYYVKH